MNMTIAEPLLRFPPVSLEELNRKAEMLDRLDNKYVISLASLRQALELLAAQFDVLTINGKRGFVYETTYYDDDALQSYHDHHQGRRKRCKIRVRTYADCGLSFLEVKLKGPAERTIKKRLRLGENGLDKSASDFVEQSYGDAYGLPFAKPLNDVIAMRYERITLVARDGGERMTIDASLTFSAGGTTRAADPGMVIIETKSARGNGIADKLLRSLHLHPVKRCSKYCVGMAALGLVTRRNRFLPALGKLGLRGDAGFLVGQPDALAA